MRLVREAGQGWRPPKRETRMPCSLTCPRCPLPCCLSGGARRNCVCVCVCVQCFDSIARIDFGAEGAAKDITAMWSAEGERVAFTAPVTAVGNVENWKRITLCDLTRDALLRCPYLTPPACVCAVLMCVCRADVYVCVCVCVSLGSYPPDGETAVDRNAWFFEYPAQVRVLAVHTLPRCV